MSALLQRSLSFQGADPPIAGLPRAVSLTTWACTSHAYAHHPCTWLTGGRALCSQLQPLRARILTCFRACVQCAFPLIRAALWAENCPRVQG